MLPCAVGNADEDSVDGAAAVVVVVTKCDEVCTVRRERLCATIIQTIPTASSSSLDE